MQDKYNKSTAEAYTIFNKSSEFYTRVGTTLVEMAQINEGESILDLACGTGVVTKLILEKLNNNGHIFSVDLSAEMLQQAKESITSSNVTFIHRSSENISPELNNRIDVAICNAAIWQMNLPNTLNAIKNVLKKGGTFVFNISQGKFNFTKDKLELKKDINDYYKQGDFIKLMKEAATEKYGLRFESDSKHVPTLDMEKVRKLLSEANLKLETYKIEELERTTQDMYEFMKIPEWTNKEFPSLTIEQRQDILERAYKKLDKNKLFLSRWIYFKVKHN